MKNLLIILSLTLTGFVSHASSGSLFSYNKELVDTEMSNLTSFQTQLENTEDSSERNILISQYDLSVASISGQNDPLGIPSFAWGFCCGLAGIVIVYVVYDDEPDQKEEAKKAVTGCLVGTAVSLIIQIAIIGVSGGA